MFTVSFICQRIFSLFDISNHRTEDTSLQTNVDYRILRGVYRLICEGGAVRSGYFIKIGAVLSKLLHTNRNDFNGALTIIMFRVNRLGSFNSLHVHSTNRNSDVLYLDRFTSMFQTQVLRRVVGVYSSTSALITDAKSNWIVRFSPTSIVKYVNTAYSDIFNVLYLRKTKVFNKGRYSRNRQFYRTGVYWCLYINIIAVIGMYFWFYRFVMNFGYLWWLFYLSLASFVIAKTLHFRLYTIKNLFNSITADIIWFAACLNVVIGSVSGCGGSIFNGIFKNFSSLMTWRFWNMFTGALNILFIGSNAYYVFVWFYNPTNYYVRSLTINPAKVFLSSGKISYLAQIRDLLIK